MDSAALLRNRSSLGPRDGVAVGPPGAFVVGTGGVPPAGVARAGARALADAYITLDKGGHVADIPLYDSAFESPVLLHLKIDNKGMTLTVITTVGMYSLLVRLQGSERESRHWEKDDSDHPCFSRPRRNEGGASP